MIDLLRGHPVHLGYLYVQDDKILFGGVFGLVNDGDEKITNENKYNYNYNSKIKYL